MREYLGVANNIAYVRDDEGKMRATVELILLHTEPFYSVDEAGKLLRGREVESFRFASGVAGMRDLARTLDAWADDIEKEQAALNAKLGGKDE